MSHDTFFRPPNVHPRTVEDEIAEMHVATSVDNMATPADFSPVSTVLAGGIALTYTTKTPPHYRTAADLQAEQLTDEAWSKRYPNLPGDDLHP